MKIQDLRVDVIVNAKAVADNNIVFKTGFLAKASSSASSDTDSALPFFKKQTIVSKDDLSTLVHADSLNEIFNGYVENTSFMLYLYDDEANLPDFLKTYQQDIQNEVRTLILSHAASEALEGESVSFDGVLVYSVADPKPYENETLVALAKKENTCVFLDPQKEGKPLYAFLSLVKSSDYPLLGYSQSLINPSFTSDFETIALRDLLSDNGFSFFMLADEGTFLWDIYIGKKQFQVSYSYFVLKEEVAFSISEWIKLGQPYSDLAISSLYVKVADTLGKLVQKNVIADYQIDIATVTDQLTSDKVKGVFRGFNLIFDEQFRIAKIHMTIAGNN